MNYSVCIDALFPDSTLDEIIPKLQAHGYDTIEFWSWWDKDIPGLKRMCEKHHIRISTFCTDFRHNPGNPSEHDVYLEALETSIKTAKELNCHMLIAQAGWHMSEISPEIHEASLIRVLKDAVPILEKSEITLIVEPLNVLVDHPGYHLSTTNHAFSILDKVGSNHIKILFDIYHQQITEGNILATIKCNLDRIGHFHLAAVPGRIEPYSGELNYPLIIERVTEMGYKDDWGLEYMPKIDAWETLKQIKQSFPA